MTHAKRAPTASSSKAGAATSRQDTTRTPTVGTLLVEVRQNGRLIATFPISADPVTVTLRDVQSGVPLAMFTGQTPVMGQVDETPVPTLPRLPDDDFTMPVPEQSLTPPPADEPSETFSHILVPDPTVTVGLALEPTGDLDAPEPETEKAPRTEAPRAAPASIPNLAQPPANPTPPRRVATKAAVEKKTAKAARTVQSRRSAPPSSSAVDDRTSPSIHRVELHTTDEEPSRTMRTPLVPAYIAEPTHSEETLSGHLIPEVVATVAPAEVWNRNASEWRSAGRLQVGQRATARSGWVELTPAGGLAVSTGPELTGTATLVDGRTREIEPNSKVIELPAGSSVILRGAGHGLYVRTDPPMPGT